MGFSSGRNAYPGASMDSIIEKLGSCSPLMTRIQDVFVDGAKLTAAVHTQRTPNPFDPRAQTKYDEAFAVAVAACALKLERISLSTVRDDGSPREAPDILLSARAQPDIGVEVIKVDETAAARVPLYQVQERIVKLLRSRPELKAANNLRFTLDYLKAGTLDDGDVIGLGNELTTFFEERRWRFLARGHYATMFGNDSVAHRCGLIVEVDDPTYATFLGFAKTDPMSPFHGILSAIERKRKLTYSQQHPLWLVVTVSDPRGPFLEAIAAAKDAQLPTEPFEKVVIHDGHENVVTVP